MEFQHQNGHVHPRFRNANAKMVILISEFGIPAPKWPFLGFRTKFLNEVNFFNWSIDSK